MNINYCFDQIRINDLKVNDIIFDIRNHKNLARRIIRPEFCDDPLSGDAITNSEIDKAEYHFPVSGDRPISDFQESKHAEGKPSNFFNKTPYGGSYNSFGLKGILFHQE